eukprot:TRINITY_DN44528_c0_g1_i1.p1 TRINITY_DN44528_c0_g1~~TRINITY_DN44528_c0_g1_i1.p1  ORF type:complete len:312 (-),score=61.74 TRINITY_DN44528_c0_g1_i1:220-1155(-)
MANYVVVGALGGIGAEVVRRLVEQPESKVAEIRAIDTKTQKHDSPILPQDRRVRFFEGDYRQPHSLRKVFANADGVFWTAATGAPNAEGMSAKCTVDVLAMQAVARLAADSGVRRFIMCSRRATIFQGETSSQAFADVKWQMLQLAEQRIRDAEIQYGIVRLGRLTTTHHGDETRLLGRAPLRAVQLLMGDPASALSEEHPTTCADAAAVLVLAMQTSSFRNTTFDLISEAPLPSDASDVPKPTGDMFCTLDHSWDLHLQGELPEDHELVWSEEGSNLDQCKAVNRRWPTTSPIKIVTDIMFCRGYLTAVH